MGSLRRALRRAHRIARSVANPENRRAVVRQTHGYADSREAAMAAFAKSWRRE